MTDFFADDLIHLLGAGLLRPCILVNSVFSMCVTRWASWDRVGRLWDCCWWLGRSLHCPDSRWRRGRSLYYPQTWWRRRWIGQQPTWDADDEAVDAETPCILTVTGRFSTSEDDGVDDGLLRRPLRQDSSCSWDTDDVGAGLNQLATDCLSIIWFVALIRLSVLIVHILSAANSYCSWGDIDIKAIELYWTVYHR